MEKLFQEKNSILSIALTAKIHTQITITQP